MLSALLSVILFINELMAANVGEVMSPATNFDSWIELYNPGSEDVRLGGMYLSNDIENLKLWQIPASVGSVPAKGFKVLWLGSNDIRSDQAPFKLDCDGGFIYLTDTDGSTIIINQFPDGSNNVCVMNIPTIAKANITSSYVTAVEQPRPDPETLEPGDANGDGVVNILDVTAIVSHLSGKTPAGFHASAADIDRDELITAADLKRVANKLIKND